MEVRGRDISLRWLFLCRIQVLLLDFRPSVFAIRAGRIPLTEDTLGDDVLKRPPASTPATRPEYNPHPDQHPADVCSVMPMTSATGQGSRIAEGRTSSAYIMYTRLSVLVII